MIMGDTFTAKEVVSFLSSQQVEQEFGILQNPNSQAFVESFHARCTLEFEIHTKPNTAKEFISEYSAYLEFYHYIRYHGSLRTSFSKKMLTPYQFQLYIQSATGELPKIEVFL